MVCSVHSSVFQVSLHCSNAKQCKVITDDFGIFALMERELDMTVQRFEIFLQDFSRRELVGKT